MNTIRKTIKWMFLLLLAGGLAAGSYAYFVWNQSDELLRQALLERLHEIAPEWRVTIGRARFDLQGRIHAYELSLKGADGLSPLIDVGEAILTVDRERLADPETPIRQVRWMKTRVHLVREPDGLWNWQKLAPPKLLSRVIPEFHLDQGSVNVQFHSAGAKPGPAVQIENFNLKLIPRAARQFLVKVSAKVPGADAVSAEGHWHLDDGEWDAAGQIRNLMIDGSLSQLAAQMSPEYEAALVRLNDFLAGSPAAATDGTAADPVTRMGFKAAADVQFRLKQWRTDAEREYKLGIHLLKGEWLNPPVPYPLRELRGDVTIDNHQIAFREMTAESGTTQIRLEQGRITDQGDRRPADFDLKISALPLDERISAMLPVNPRKVYDDLRVSGAVDLVAHLEYNGLDHWSHDCDVFARNCTASHVKFPYPVDQVEGTLKQRGDQIEVAMQGRAGTRRVVLSGRVKNPGPEAASLITVETAGIPIDDQLRTACPANFQRVIDQLQAQGELEGRVRLVRPAGLDQPLSILVDARVSNGSINCRNFPYPLSDVTGEFQGSGTTWTFKNCRGQHGGAEAAFSGDFRPGDDGLLRLALDFSLMGADLDRELRSALPLAAQKVWKEFNPEGALNVPSGTVYWWPDSGGRTQLARLEAEITDATLSLQSFPYDLTDVAARISYDGELANIISFSGKHEETVIRVDGGFAECKGDGEWRVRLEPMFVDDLEATPQFRKALPQRLWKIVDALNPRGKQSITGMIEFRGNQGEVTAAWDTETDYSGSTMNAGVDLRDIRGKAFFRGTWDGEQAICEGRIKLNSVKIFDFQLANVEGPVRINGSRLILGLDLPAKGTAPIESDPSRHVKARFIDGLVLLDAVVTLGEPMKYRVHTTLKDGDLRRYAQLHMAGHNNLAGRMNGTVDFTGTGTNPKSLSGAGQLVISPAALYELPVIVQVFNVISFVPPEKTAFNKAMFAFGIGGGHVHFDRIDLVGDAITLVGQGTVGFDGNVRLNFASRMGKRQWPIPIIHQAIGEVSKDWILVDVGGSLKDPKPEVRSRVDEALRRLLGIGQNPQRR